MKVTDAQSLRKEEEFIHSAVELIQQASRYLCIRSPFLAPELFNTPEVNDAISEFVRRSRYAEVHILVDFTDHIVKTDHFTFELARRMSQKIIIKEYYDHKDEKRESFMISDGCGLLIKYHETDKEGLFSLTDKVATQQLRDEFEHDWQRSAVPRQLRTLSI